MDLPYVIWISAFLCLRFLIKIFLILSQKSFLHLLDLTIKVSQKMVSSFLNNFLDIALFELVFQVKLYHEYVGNKAKGQILKRVFQENKVRQIIRKTNISYPLIRTRTCACQGLRNVRFSEKLACFVFFKNQF